MDGKPQEVLLVARGYRELEPGPFEVLSKLPGCKPNNYPPPRNYACAFLEVELAWGKRYLSRKFRIRRMGRLCSLEDVRCQPYFSNSQLSLKLIIISTINQYVSNEEKYTQLYGLMVSKRDLTWSVKPFSRACF